MQRLFYVAMAVLSAMTAMAQTSDSTAVPISVDSKLVFDAAGPEQRKSLGNIYLVACPTGAGAVIGTGFVIDSGVVVTNAHVTATCDQNNLVGISPSNDRVAFSKVIKDQNRDLAVLVPTKKLSGGFKLADADDPAPGTAVSTWGYPFAYNGVSPLLSVGYVSGYRTVPSGGLRVKHIVVNGAFNHGNSGGPLLISQHDEVIGIVVLTYNFYPAEVKQIIDALTAQRSGFMMGSITKADGTKESISEAQITAMVLNEFYEKTQVMIGEAIAVSELKNMIKDHAQELPKTPSTGKLPH